MKLGKQTLVMCRLVAFVESELKLAVSPRLDVERYARKVLKRFQEIVPNAVLILGNDEPPVGCYDYVKCSVDNMWTFSTSGEFGMSVEARTDGSIHLDWGTAEQVFNFVSD